LDQQVQSKSANIAIAKTIDKTKLAPNGPNVQIFEVITSPQENCIPVK